MRVPASPRSVAVRSRLGSSFADRATARDGDPALFCPGILPRMSKALLPWFSVRWLISRDNAYTGRCADRPRAVRLGYGRRFWLALVGGHVASWPEAQCPKLIRGASDPSGCTTTTAPR